MDLGGALWIIIDIVFVVALAGALAYGAIQWQRIKDDRRSRQSRDAATRENYEEGG